MQKVTQPTLQKEDSESLQISHCAQPIQVPQAQKSKKKLYLIVSLALLSITIIITAVLCSIYIKPNNTRTSTVSHISSQKMNLNNDDITVNTYKVEEKGTKNKLELTKMSKQIEHEGKQITVSCYYGTDTELNITFQMCEGSKEKKFFIDQETILQQYKKDPLLRSLSEQEVSEILNEFIKEELESEEFQNVHLAHFQQVAPSNIHDSSENLENQFEITYEVPEDKDENEAKKILRRRLGFWSKIKNAVKKVGQFIGAGVGAVIGFYAGGGIPGAIKGAQIGYNIGSITQCIAKYGKWSCLLSSRVLEGQNVIESNVKVVGIIN